MKHFFLLLFLVCSFAVYGQNTDNTDLIVTTTGDSLHCKILEVTAERIQFRFGTGTVIPISRSEVASYQYNYTVIAITYENGTREASGANTKQPKENVHTAGDHSKFYVGLVAGGIPEAFSTIGFNVAYFFNHQIGLGFAVHHSDVDGEKFTFFGPEFYGHWGRRNGKFFFPTILGFGMISDVWKSTYYDYSENFFGFITSVGAAYKPVKSFSFGMNLELGSDFDFWCLVGGFTLSAHFHF